MHYDYASKNNKSVPSVSRSICCIVIPCVYATLCFVQPLQWKDVEFGNFNPEKCWCALWWEHFTIMKENIQSSEYFGLFVQKYVWKFLNHSYFQREMLTKVKDFFVFLPTIDVSHSWEILLLEGNLCNFERICII